MQKTKYVQHKKLQCSINSVTYHFDERTGHLYMREHECCDMSGAIEFFESIDPKVKHIKTYSGFIEDTCYQLKGKKWVAIWHRQ